MILYLLSSGRALGVILLCFQCLLDVYQGLLILETKHFLLSQGRIRPSQGCYTNKPSESQEEEKKKKKSGHIHEYFGLLERKEKKKPPKTWSTDFTRSGSLNKTLVHYVRTCAATLRARHLRVTFHNIWIKDKIRRAISYRCSRSRLPTCDSSQHFVNKSRAVDVTERHSGSWIRRLCPTLVSTGQFQVLPRLLLFGSFRPSVKRCFIFFMDTFKTDGTLSRGHSRSTIYPVSLQCGASCL